MSPDTIGRVGALPPISLRCDCGASGAVAYGKRWECPSCGKTYDTTTIPKDDVDALASGLRRYRLLTLGPPLALAAVMVPLAVLDDVSWGFLLFFFTLAHGLFVLPRIRQRAHRHVRESTSRWKLEAE
jgi:hypothetical protein